MRYSQIRRNLETLRSEKLVPDQLEKAADVGFGSGAGSIVLAELFPQAIITAIDNASSQQNHPDYYCRNFPKWTSRIETVLDDAREAAPKLGVHDLVLASRPNMVDHRKKTTWEEGSLFIAGNFIALAEMTEPKSGVALVGYNPHEDPGALWELAKRVDVGKLFNRLVRYEVENGDDWLVLSGVKQEVLKKAKRDRTIILTDIGKKIPNTEELKNLWKS